MQFYHKNEGIEFEVNGKRYPAYIYEKAYRAANQDERLREEISNLEKKYIEKYCVYFTCEERQKNAV